MGKPGVNRMPPSESRASIRGLRFLIPPGGCRQAGRGSRGSGPGASPGHARKPSRGEAPGAVRKAASSRLNQVERRARRREPPAPEAQPVAGRPGLEPGPTGPEPVVLPLHHRPMRAGRLVHRSARQTISSIVPMHFGSTPFSDRSATARTDAGFLNRLLVKVLNTSPDPTRQRKPRLPESRTSSPNDESRSQRRVWPF